MKQVITIRPDGTMFGLDHHDKGLQLRNFGHSETRRETLISFDSDYQMWYIEWFAEGGLEPTLSGVDIVNDAFHWDFRKIFDETGLDCGDFEGSFHGKQCFTCLFEDYRKAVEFEVAVIQKLQEDRRVAAHIIEGKPAPSTIGYEE